MAQLLDKRFLIKVGICQLITVFVLSCLSIAYLTVVFYLPSYRALTSAFLETPVMCTTVSSANPDTCEKVKGKQTWSSCTDGCLSKPKLCVQVRVDVRRNGTNVQLKDCDLDSLNTKYCAGYHPDMPKYSCIDGECAVLHGLFNCSPESPPADNYRTGSVCTNMTSYLTCNLTETDTPVVCNTRKACLGFDGLYECNYGECAKIRPPFTCKKQCIDINVRAKNFIIRRGEDVHTVNCAQAVDIDTKQIIWPPPNSRDPSSLLLITCTTFDIAENKSEFVLSDCLNGMSFSADFYGHLISIKEIEEAQHNRLMLDLDPIRAFVPMEEHLLIYNSTPLYINHNSCLMSSISRKGCDRFQEEYGVVKKGYRSPSTFPCFYSPQHKDYVVLSFNKRKTMKNVTIALAVPVILAIASLCALLICKRFIQRKGSSDDRFGKTCFGADHRPVENIAL